MQGDMSGWEERLGMWWGIIHLRLVGPLAMMVELRLKLCNSCLHYQSVSLHGRKPAASVPHRRSAVNKLGTQFGALSWVISQQHQVSATTQRTSCHVNSLCPSPYRVQGSTSNFRGMLSTCLYKRLCKLLSNVLLPPMLWPELLTCLFQACQLSPSLRLLHRQVVFSIPSHDMDGTKRMPARE